MESREITAEDIQKANMDILKIIKKSLIIELDLNTENDNDYNDYLQARIKDVEHKILDIKKQ